MRLDQYQAEDKDETAQGNTGNEIQTFRQEIVDGHSKGHRAGCGEEHQRKIRYVEPVEKIGVSSSLAYSECCTKEEEIGEEENNRLPFTFSDVKESVEVLHKLTVP